MGKFLDLKESATRFYKNIECVVCPYFNEKINFNSQGFEHLFFRNRNRPRKEKDQEKRFRLLYLAPEVLKMSRTLQGIWKTKKFEKVRINSRTEIVLKDVIYYEFIAIINNVRVKIIVKQIENEEKFFWSIIPFWGFNKKSLRKKMHSGLPEED